MNATSQWHLWESLGFSLGQVEAGAKNLADMNKDWLESPPTGDGREFTGWVSTHVIFGRDLFLLGWMGHPVPDPDLGDWRGIGRRSVSACLHYFFGDWRQSFLYYDDLGYGAVPCDLPRSRTRLPWLTPPKELAFQSSSRPPRAAAGAACGSCVRRANLLPPSRAPSARPRPRSATIAC